MGLPALEQNCGSVEGTGLGRAVNTGAAKSAMATYSIMNRRSTSVWQRVACRLCRLACGVERRSAIRWDRCGTRGARGGGPSTNNALTAQCGVRTETLRPRRVVERRPTVCLRVGIGSSGWTPLGRKYGPLGLVRPQPTRTYVTRRNPPPARVLRRDVVGAKALFDPPRPALCYIACAYVYCADLSRCRHRCAEYDGCNVASSDAGEFRR